MGENAPFFLKIVGQYCSKYPDIPETELVRHGKLGLAIAHATHPSPPESWQSFCVRRQITAYLSTLHPPKPPKALPPPSNRENAVVEAFVTRFLPLVKETVYTFRDRLPEKFETADLMGAGRLGLVIAARSVPRTVDPARFDPAKWARFCIRRQMLNEICGNSKGQPLGDGKRNQETGAWVQAKQTESLEEEDAGGNDLGNRGPVILARAAVQPLEEARPIYGRRRRAVIQIALPDRPSEPRPEVARLNAATRRLTVLQQRLLELVYDQGVSLRVVGRKKMLGVGWRRAQREHDAAIATLRAEMGKAA